MLQGRCTVVVWNVGRLKVGDGRHSVRGEFPGMVGSGEVLGVWGNSAIPVASYVTYAQCQWQGMNVCVCSEVLEKVYVNFGQYRYKSTSYGH